MKTIALLSLILFISSAQAFDSTEIERNVSAFVDVFIGFKDGFVMKAFGDYYAFGECLYGFPCVYSILADLFKGGFKGLSQTLPLFFTGAMGCLNTCMVPGGYVYRYSQLFGNGTIAEKLRKFSIAGLAACIMEIRIEMMSIIQLLITGKLRAFGYSLGKLTFCILVR